MSTRRFICIYCFAGVLLVGGSARAQNEKQPGVHLDLTAGRLEPDHLGAALLVLHPARHRSTADRPTPLIDSAWRQRRELTLVLGDGVTMELVRIPRGTFMMGSPDTEEGRYKEEGPQHRVRIGEAFYMGKCEVTQAQWQAVMGGNPSHFKGDDRPVETVSWEDCQAFCRKLSERTGRGIRLPSEAEWEYACRAGTTTPFSFGETISTDQANYCGNYSYGKGRKGVYREKTTPAGSFPANAWGLHDMHGNVWEWCEDYYHDNYRGAPGDGSAWTWGEKQKHVCGGVSSLLRGGSWVNRPDLFRSAARLGAAQGGRDDEFGFRVASGLRNALSACPD